MTSRGDAPLGRPLARELPGIRVALDREVTFWAGGLVAMGGSPWRVIRLAETARPFVQRLQAAGPRGCVPAPGLERAIARRLVDRGFVHPVIEPDSSLPPVTILVPAFNRVEQLEDCLRSLEGTDVVVIDDASHDLEAMRQVTESYGGRLLRHETNRGPAAARNTGIAAAQSPFLAFVDSDCVVGRDWLNHLLPHFEDPLVGAVAPRVRPLTTKRSLLGRHENARSALDMGSRPEQVHPGARLGFLPSAALVVRRAALGLSGFDEALQVGEDVDLVWRLIDAGWQIRYEPGAEVRHEPRLRVTDWITRRFQYGTSAADLHCRHPGRLAPARLSAWNLASLILLITRRPLSAALVSTVAAGLLGRRLRRAGGVAMAVTIVGKGLFADAVAVGHALRREWWPLGWLALATVGRSRFSRAAALCMLGPIALEWVRHRPDIDPARYAGLRLAEDAAYGSGVITSAWQARSAAPLRPEVRLPFGNWGWLRDRLVSRRSCVK
jgi:mycofactocin glycosyltransferase